MDVHGGFDQELQSEGCVFSPLEHVRSALHWNHFLLNSKLLTHTRAHARTRTDVVWIQANKLLLRTLETEERLPLPVLWRHIWGTEVQLHSFLTSALGGGELLASRPVRSNPGKDPAMPVGQENEWGPTAGVEFSRGEQFLGPARIRNPDHSAPSLVTVLNSRNRGKGQ